MSKASEKRAQQATAAMIRPTCDNLALHLLSLEEPTRWAGWVLYVLEKLEAMDAESEPSEIGDGVTFSWVLEQVRAGIDGRLSGGTW